MTCPYCNGTGRLPKLETEVIRPVFCSCQDPLADEHARISREWAESVGIDLETHLGWRVPQPTKH